MRFIFKAYDSSGKIVNGEIDAEDHFTALNILRADNLSIAKLESQTKKRHSFWQRDVSKHVAFFFRQLAVLIDSSTLEESLAAMKFQRDNRFLFELANFLHEQISNGRKFHDSLERYNFDRAEIFSEYVIGMVKVGEESGRLSQIFELLANFLEKEFIRREKFQSSLVYPKILFGIALVAIGFLLTFILPTFANLFDSFHAELPLPTRILLTLGNFLFDYGLLIFVVIIGLIIAFEILYRREDFRLIFDRFKLQIPIFGELERQIACMYIFRALAVMLESGMPIDDATKILHKIPPNRFFQKILREFHDRILHGLAIPKFFENQQIFPRSLVSLIQAGYQSGMLEEMFQKCGDYCELNADNLSTRMQSMIEPILILILACIIFTFAISIVLPLLDAMTQIGR